MTETDPEICQSFGQSAGFVRRNEQKKQAAALVRSGSLPWKESVFRAAPGTDALVGSGVQVGIAAPDHVLAQLLAHELHLVLFELGALGVEEGTAVLVIGDPCVL